MKPTPSAPDLFSTEATPKSRSEAEKKPAQPLLPKDLTGALQHLDDAELDRLLAAVTGEAERRGRLPKLTPASTASRGEQTAVALTRGQLSAVRAAFKAGVKPSAISRQFGISQSDVRKALVAEGPGQMRR